MEEYGIRDIEESTLGYWDEVLTSRGFESDVTYGTAHETWYGNGDFHVSYDAEDFRDKTCPAFVIIYHGNGWRIKVCGHLKIPGFTCLNANIYVYNHGKRDYIVEVPEFLFVLDALVEPKRLPLCIGIEWAEELVSVFLQRSAAGKTLQEK